MIILTAAALAAAQPVSAPPAPAGPHAGHVSHGAGHANHGAGHAGHAQAQQGQPCPCCARDGTASERDCCAEHRREPRR